MSNEKVFRRSVRGVDYVSFRCPGCDMFHTLPLGGNVKNQNVWTWNEDVTCPTILPSIKSSVELYGNRPVQICHSYVKEGQIEFLSDCTHELRGSTVPLNSIE